MEIAGVRIDVTALNEASVALTTRLQEIEAEVFELAGEEFNIGSPAKVGEILFDKLRLDPKAKKTKTGQYSTSEEVLEKIAHLHPIVGKVLEHRQLRKLLSTYLNALPNTINPSTGKIHTTYNQTVTATGRLSSTEPNLQNIPVRDDVGREIRRAFIADEGHLFLSADYSQIELRLVADLAADEVMLDAFANDKDIHAITAAKIYKVPLEEVTATQRRNAKTANFGILYGISAFGLASRLSIPRAEAKQLIDGYFATFPTVQTYMNEAIEKAREKGYVTTIMGRKRMLPDINSRNAVVRGYAERNAINAPIQGSAADIIKVAMVSIFNEMTERNLKSKMIMQVHDELNFDVAADELDVMRELVSRNMEAAYSGRVRLTASCGVGPNWLTAH
ncbi:MAG: DNA polymerase I, partial [Muribaculaceae bacterium]|nr:DNA polymerase I [Muribaculaceae bacterium]